MKYLARVWDRSEGSIANNYWACNVAGAELGGFSITPFYSRLYSHESPGFRSENNEIRKAVDKVS